MGEIFAVFYREFIKFFRDKERLALAVATPILSLVVCGGSMSGVLDSIIGSTGTGNVMEGFNFSKFIFPGIITMAMFTSALASATSIVQDRERGILNVILVSPINRWKLALGKILSGTVIGLFEGFIVLIFAPVVDVSLSTDIILRLIPLMVLISLSISSITVLLASYIKSIQVYHGLSGFLSTTIVFLSGAFIPINGLPQWLQVVVKLNPLTYAVDMMRKLVLNIESMDSVVKNAFGMNLTLFGNELLLAHEQIVLIIITIVFLILVTVKFTISEYN